jgi:hypothetical protein
VVIRFGEDIFASVVDRCQAREGRGKEELAPIFRLFGEEISIVIEMPVIVGLEGEVSYSELILWAFGYYL